MNILKRLMIYIIKFYIKYISRLKPKPTCRYYPTCSVYSLQAFEKYGFIKGSFLSAKRILSCHPFSKGGHDPLI